MGFCVSREIPSRTLLLACQLSAHSPAAVILDSDLHTDIQKYYTFEKLLGRGYMGEVRRAQCKRTKETVAVRSVRKSEHVNEGNGLKEKLALFRVLDHPNVLKFYEMYEDERFFHVVMELCEGGSLAERVVSQASFRESEVRQLFSKLVRAVIHIHSKGLCHRDLRPENILFEDKGSTSEFKIANFADMTFKQIGNVIDAQGMCIDYMAPELIKGEFAPECDVWSLGCILYFLLSGQLPFDNSDESDQIQHIVAGDLVFEGPWNRVSAAAKDLVKKMVIARPGLRIPLNDVLQEKWLTTNSCTPTLSFHTLRALVAYKPPSRLQRDLLLAVVKHIPQGSLQSLNVLHIQDAFTALDSDKTGVLSIDKLKEVFARSNFLQPEIQCDAYLALLESLASKGDGQLRYSEFLVAVRRYETELSDDALFLAFKNFDLVACTQDDDGHISLSEMCTALRNLGSSVTEEELKQELPKFAADCSGRIDFEEFKALLTNFQTTPSP